MRNICSSSVMTRMVQVLVVVLGVKEVRITSSSLHNEPTASVYFFVFICFCQEECIKEMWRPSRGGQ